MLTRITLYLCYYLTEKKSDIIYLNYKVAAQPKHTEQTRLHILLNTFIQTYLNMNYSMDWWQYSDASLYTFLWNVYLFCKYNIQDVFVSLLIFSFRANTIIKEKTRERMTLNKLNIVQNCKSLLSIPKKNIYLQKKTIHSLTFYL